MAQAMKIFTITKEDIRKLGEKSVIWNWALYSGTHWLKGLTTIFAGQENPFIIFWSKEIYMYYKTNNKIPINLVE